MDEQIEEVKLESTASAERQAEATKMGWIPPDRYKGAPERYVDAEDYIKRGEEVLPFVKNQLEKARGELNAVLAREAQTQTALAQAQKAIEQIELRHSVATQKAVEKAKADVKAQLAIASEAGDHTGVAELTEQLVELNAAVKEEPVVTTPPPPAWQPSPEMKAWNEENPWYGTDKERTDMANKAARLLRISGETSVGKAFLDLAKADMEVAWEKKHPTPVDKTLGGRGGEGGGPAGGGGRKTYAAMPADARRQCDADARQFVGPNKAYKTAAEWQSAFAQLYFEQE